MQTKMVHLTKTAFNNNFLPSNMIFETLLSQGIYDMCAKFELNPIKAVRTAATQSIENRTKIGESAAIQTPVVMVGTPCTDVHWFQARRSQIA